MIGTPNAEAARQFRDKYADHGVTVHQGDVGSVEDCARVGGEVLEQHPARIKASARVLRAQTLSVRNREYVLASRASGERAWRIVLVEIVPNELPIIVSQFIFSMIFAILTEAGLAFLGLANPSQLTWGNMLYFAQNDQAISSGAWWWFIPPGLCIALLGMGLALINFSLDEILNPRLRVYRPPSHRRARSVSPDRRRRGFGSHGARPHRSGP